MKGLFLWFWGAAQFEPQNQCLHTLHTDTSRFFVDNSSSHHFGLVLRNAQGWEKGSERSREIYAVHVAICLIYQ